MEQRRGEIDYNCDGQWVKCLQNLRLLVRLLEETNSSADLTIDLEFIDVAAIARQQDSTLVHEQLLLLCAAMLFTAVHSPQAQTFIDGILNLEEGTQSTLMVLIQDMDKRLEFMAGGNSVGSSTLPPSMAPSTAPNPTPTPMSTAPARPRLGDVGGMTPGAVYMDADRESLMHKMSEYRRQIATLQRENYALDNDRVGLLNRLETESLTQEQMARLNKEQMNALLSEATTRCEVLQQSVDAANEKMMQAEQRAAEFEQRLGDATRRLRVDGTRVAELEEKLTSQMHATSKAELAAATQAQELKAARATMAKLEEVNQTLLDRLGDDQVRVGSAVGASEQLAKVEAELHAEMRRAAQAEVDIKRWRDKAAALEDAGRDAAGTIEGLQLKLTATTDEFERVMRENSTLLTKVQQGEVMARVDQRMAEITELKNRNSVQLASDLKMALERVELADQRMRDGMVRAAEAEARAADLETELEDARADMAHKDRVIEEVGGQAIASHTAETASRIADLEDRLHAALGRAAEVDVLRRRLDEVREAARGGTDAMLEKLRAIADARSEATPIVPSGASADQLHVALESARAEVREVTERLAAAEKARADQAVSLSQSQRPVDGEQLAEVQAELRRVETDLRMTRAEHDRFVKQAARGGSQRDIEEALKLTAFTNVGLQMMRLRYDMDRAAREHAEEVARLRRIIAAKSGHG